MKQLFIGPLAPPTTGQSLAFEVLIQVSASENQVSVINLSKNNLSNGNSSWSRIKEIIFVLLKIRKNRKNNDVIYLTISESLLGNIKDLLIYCLCYASIRKFVIHLHGGSIGKMLFEKSRIVKTINKFFIRKMKAVIILGESHREIFKDFIDNEKIHKIPNFAQDDLFLDKEKIIKKFKNTQPLHILFFSNLMQEKGFNELLEAFILLDLPVRKKFKIKFAGAFENENERTLFIKKICNYEEVEYCGVVTGVEKELLLKQSHIFCLPTNYLEGQPISILEAYASGCVVLTTMKGGIVDIFVRGVNGYEIKPKSPESICRTLKELITKVDGNKLASIAITNNCQASENYRLSSYANSLLEVINSN